MFIVLDDMKVTREKITNSTQDPNSLIKIRNMIVNVTRDMIMMQEVLGFITEALGIMPVPPEPPEQAGRSLYARLQINDAKVALGSRVKDLNKNIVGTFHERDLLSQMSIINTNTKHFHLYNTRCFWKMNISFKVNMAC